MHYVSTLLASMVNKTVFYFCWQQDSYDSSYKGCLIMKLKISSSVHAQWVAALKGVGVERCARHAA